MSRDREEQAGPGDVALDAFSKVSIQCDHLELEFDLSTHNTHRRLLDPRRRSELSHVATVSV